MMHSKWRRSTFMDKVMARNGLLATFVTRNLAIRKSFLFRFIKEGNFLFDERMFGTGGEDRELGYRLSRKGARIKLEEKAIVYHEDPIKLKDILIQKYNHGAGDAKLGICERFYDLRNFKRVVLKPLKVGVPLFFSLLIWVFHTIGSEKELLRQKLAFFSDESYDIGKRAIDLFLSSCGLVLGLPIFMIIAALIKVESRGSVFFLQKRVGKKGKIFKMYKFRTMVADAENLLYNTPDLFREYQSMGYKLKNDPRVTKIGRILRKYSLDELPQLINILKGEMSAVGPRAYKEDELKTQLARHNYSEKYLEKVLSVKPGLTGVWQVTGRSEIDFKERIFLDFTYSRRKSIPYDFLIILKTIPAVFKAKGAW